VTDNAEEVHTGRFRGNFSILGCESLGHCENKSSYKHLSNSGWLWRYSSLNLQTQNHCKW